VFKRNVFAALLVNVTGQRLIMCLCAWHISRPLWTVQHKSWYKWNDKVKC